MKKSIFGMHDPLGLRYILQLRMGLSYLRYHKKCHIFINTPSDKCLCNHGIEDTKNLLFCCPFLAAQRVLLAISVIKIIHKYNPNHLCDQSYLYLYENETINFADNTKILLSTIKYIKVNLLPYHTPSPSHNNFLVLS